MQPSSLHPNRTGATAGLPVLLPGLTCAVRGCLGHPGVVQRQWGHPGWYQPRVSAPIQEQQVPGRDVCPSRTPGQRCRCSEVLSQGRRGALCCGTCPVPALSLSWCLDRGKAHGRGSRKGSLQHRSQAARMLGPTGAFLSLAVMRLRKSVPEQLSKFVFHG